VERKQAVGDTALLWFRRDLRLDDHPALLAAAAGGRRVVGLFVLDPRLIASSGQPRLHFLHRCLAALSESMDGKLLVVRGRPEQVLPAVVRQVEAAEVHITADCMPYGIRRDEQVEQALDVPLVRTGSPYAVTPGRVRKNDGSSYAVFTPFFRAWTAHGWHSPAGAGGGVDWLTGPRLEVDGEVAVADLEQGGADPSLPPGGEHEAVERWRDFRDHRMADYGNDRNRPDHDTTSRLSPYLKYGCLHPRTLLADIKDHPSAGASRYRSELAWREFYADLIFQQPGALWTSVYPSIDAMQWDEGRPADERFEAWQQGRTGYPYVDAAMRQLLAEGWMHNRARMCVASFLIKDLHLPWQRGAKHFLDHLVDGDVSSNNMGWQWVAGAGPQAAPFYRVFNPITQGEKFDPNGEYVRRYVPELRGVAGKAVQTPWDLPDGIPGGYPERIVDHATERVEALRRNEARS
jgi:deoxyribodipyrimidine photo-lyase